MNPGLLQKLASKTLPTFTHFETIVNVSDVTVALVAAFCVQARWFAWTGKLVQWAFVNV